jgi:GNAT superfamily N-acetyltransferase
MEAALRGAAGQPLLINGRAVSIRQVHADDVGMLTRLLLRLSPRSCHQRYLVARAFTPASARAVAERIVAARTRRHIALIATTPLFAGDDLVGVAELARLDEGPALGELALMVRDDMQRAGIGALLLGALRAAAPQLGLRTLQMDVLAGNVAMRRLAGRLGAPSVRWMGDGVVQLRVDLADPSEPQLGALSTGREFASATRRVA